MKTTVELPDSVVQQAETLAANRGMTLKQYLSNILEEKFCRYSKENSEHENEAPWMKGFGELSDLSDENRRILEIIEEEFGKIDTENHL